MSYKDKFKGGSGNLVERIACPLCGWLRTRNYGVSSKTGKVREVRFDKVDLEHALILRVERLQGRGRGSKQASIELIDGKTLAEIEPEVKQQIKEQCSKIIEILSE